MESEADERRQERLMEGSDAGRKKNIEGKTAIGGDLTLNKGI